MEPLAVGWHAVKYSGVIDNVGKGGEGKTDLGLGTGMIGIATVAWLIAFGVEEERIVVVGRSKARNGVVRQLRVEKIYGNEEDIVRISRGYLTGKLETDCLKLSVTFRFAPVAISKLE